MSFKNDGIGGGGGGGGIRIGGGGRGGGRGSGGRSSSGRIIDIKTKKPLTKTKVAALKTKKLASNVSKSRAAADVKKAAGSRIAKRTAAGVAGTAVAKKVYNSRPKPSPKPAIKKVKSYNEIIKNYPGSAGQRAGMTRDEYYRSVIDPNYRWKQNR